MPEGCRRSDARTGFKSFTAAIVAACLLVPAVAAAQEPLPIEPPSTGIPLADELTREVQREAGALAPDVVDPGPSGHSPPSLGQASQSIRRRPIRARAIRPRGRNRLRSMSPTRRQTS